MFEALAKLFGREPRSTPFGFDCAHCNRRAPLRVVLHAWRYGVPHDAPGHDSAYQLNTLYRCPACDMLQLEIFDHDCFSPHETWNLCLRHTIAPAGEAALLARVAACPAPLDARCGCRIHQAVREGLPSVEQSEGRRYGS